MSMINSNDTIGNRTCDLPVCSAVPQPTAGRRLNIQREVLEGRREILNNCVGQSPSSEADIPSVTQQIRRILHSSKAHYLIHTVSFPSLSWARSIQFTPPSICSKACFNIILPSKPRSSKLPLPLRFSHQNLYALLLFPYVSHAPSISFPFIWSFGCLVMATNHKTTHDDTSSTPLLLHLSYGQMSCAPVLEHLQPLFLSQCPWPRFTPTQNNRQNYSSECLICIFLDNKSTEGRIWTRW